MNVLDVQIVARAGVGGSAQLGKTVFEIAYSIHVDGCSTQYYTQTVTACRARVDKCNLPDKQVAWEPCTE
jgi:hypothetical protein